METMKFGSSMEDEDSDYLQLFFPLVVAHKIDASSPLFELSPKDLQAKQFEIIVSLEGTTPETGNTIQASTVVRSLPTQKMYSKFIEIALVLGAVIQSLSFVMYLLFFTCHLLFKVF